MINVMRVVLGYSKLSADEPTYGDLAEQYAGFLALGFCDNLPADFVDIKGSVKAFGNDVWTGLKDAEPAKDDQLHMIKATQDAWNALEPVKMPSLNKLQKWKSKYKTDKEYRSILLLKAFVGGFRSITLRLSGTVPPPASLDTLWKITSTEKPVGDADKLFKIALDKFKSVPIKSVVKKPEEVPVPEKGQTPAEKPGKLVPVDKAIKTDLQEINKNIKDVKTLPESGQIKLRGLITEIEELLTAPAGKTAALDDAISRLVKFIHPVLQPFLKKLHEERVEVPADNRVWNDPDRLREMLGRMEPEHMKRVLKQTEKILGMLVY